jgi:hypothetical protein
VKTKIGLRTEGVFNVVMRSGNQKADEGSSMVSTVVMAKEKLQNGANFISLKPKISACMLHL